MCKKREAEKKELLHHNERTLKEKDDLIIENQLLKVIENNFFLNRIL